MKTMLAMVLAFPPATHAATIFSDNFDTNTQAQDVTPAGWFIDAGAVDIIGGAKCHSSPNCVNLDGHTNDPRVTENGIGHLFTATTGVTYDLLFWLAGAEGQANTVDVALGDNTFTFLVAADDAPSLHTVSWLATHGGFETFTFGNRGNDSVGAVLDDVRLDTREAQATTPEPGASALIGSGLLTLGLLFRKRQSRRRK